MAITEAEPVGSNTENEVGGIFPKHKTIFPSLTLEQLSTIPRKTASLVAREVAIAKVTGKSLLPAVPGFAGVVLIAIFISCSNTQEQERLDQALTATAQPTPTRTPRAAVVPAPTLTPRIINP